MGLLDSIFGDSTTKNTSTNTTGTNQGNAWNDPRLQAFLNNYAQSAQGFSSANVPINQWQTGAANAQQTVAPGLGVTASQFGDIYKTGLDPAQIQRYINPEVQNVVNATQADFDKQNKQAILDAGGNSAKNLAFGNTNRLVGQQLAKESNERVQAPVIAGLRSKAYTDAVQAAATNAGIQTSALQGATGAQNAQTGANSALGGLGANIWQAGYQNAQLPAQLQASGAAGLNGLFANAGTSSSGTSNGTETSTATPSLASVVGGGLGMLASGFGGGMPLFGAGLGSGLFSGTAAGVGQLPWRPFGGNMPATYATGGAVGDKHAGHKTLHHKVAEAFDMLQGLRDKATSKAYGGKVRGYEEGGTPTNDDAYLPNDDYPWDMSRRRSSAIAGIPRPGPRIYSSDATVVPGVYRPGSSDTSDTGPEAERGNGANTTGMGAMSYSPRARSFAPTGDSNGWFQGGMWAGERETNPVRNFGRALMAIRSPRFNSPFGGVNDQLDKIREQNIQEKGVDRLMEQLELERQRVALEAAKNPAQIALMQAQTKVAETSADKQFLLDIEKQKIAYAKEIEQAAKQGDWELVQRIRQQQQADDAKNAAARGAQGSGADIGFGTGAAAGDKHYVWGGDQQTTPATETTPATTPATPAKAPTAPDYNPRRILGRSQDLPKPSKEVASYGDYYRDVDGVTIRQKKSTTRPGQLDPVVQ